MTYFNSKGIESRGKRRKFARRGEEGKVFYRCFGALNEERGGEVGPFLGTGDVT